MGLVLELFRWIYTSRLITRTQLALAIRGELVENDRYLGRATRKLFDHAYVGKLPTHPFEPEIYCVPARATRGRKAAKALFGDESKITRNPAGIGTAERDHALTVTWLRVFVHLASQAQGWDAEFLDHQDLSQRCRGLALIPDGAVLLDKRAAQGLRLFLIEYQAAYSARRTTRDKVERYQVLLPELERRFGAERSWVVFVQADDERHIARLSNELEREGITGNTFLGSRDRVLAVRPQDLWTAQAFYLPGEKGLVSIFAARREEGVIYEAR